MFQLPPQMRDSASPNEADQLANMTSFLSVLCFFLPLPHAKLLFRIRSCRKELRRHLWLSKLWSVHGGVVLSYQLRRSYPRNTIRTFYPLKFHTLFPLYTNKDTREYPFHIHYSQEQITYKMSVVNVKNISSSTSEKEVKDFFSFW